MDTTLGELRYELTVRLGFSTQGDIVNVQTPILNSFIRQAQHFIYFNVEDERLFRTQQRPAGLGQSLFNLPDDCEPRKKLSVWVRHPAHGHRWKVLKKAQLFADEIEESLDHFTPAQRANSGVSGEVSAYRVIGNQIEVAPAFEAEGCELRFDYVCKLGRLVQDQDVLTLEREAVFMLALATAKAHYKHDDAAQQGQIFERYLKNLRGREHDNAVYKRSR